ncbi:hypothetical protein [Streptomyces scabiei]|uniref:hypothetical protein n=1 Tax=Streptomyces scabiei TaxID=1930 RepID=UPI0029B32C71|nr:hypothetical protein [Streptomyces scabiei]MDX3516785.1 hypothetical protein [Streptomyces scabiei]
MTSDSPAPDAPTVAPPTGDVLFDQALVEEATKKSGLVWVRGGGALPGREGPSRALWHVWHEGAACLVGDGPGEQPFPDLVDGGAAVVTVRSKDKGGRLVGWAARVVELAPGSLAWEAAVAELKGKRLNAPDGEAMPARWARECRVLRLEPTGTTLPAPDGDQAQPPVPTSATTRAPIPAAVPRLLFGRRKRS